MNPLTLEFLKSFMEYDPLIGKFIRLKTINYRAGSML